jgi:uncharacterized damage-inducible protein DinB
VLVSELLLPEFDSEMKKTRTTLERIPVDKRDFAPHPRSMPLGKLAPHVAQLTGFGVLILTAPELNFATANLKPIPLESAAQLVRALDEGAAQTRSALAAMPDDAWKENWKLRMGDRILFDGSRFLGYRQMFINHIVHHRAQLGVYLRMNEGKVPSIYGPSADETLGF